MFREIRKALIYNEKIAIFKPFLLHLYATFFSPILKDKEKNNLEFIVSKKKKFVFVLNPKVASRSLIDFFSKSNIDFSIVETDLKTVHKNYPSNIYNYYALTRNPYYRLLSCFAQKIINTDPVIRARIHSQFTGIDKIQSLENFIDWLLTSEGSDKVADRHWKSQTKILYLDEFYREPSYENIGRIEEIDKFIEYFSNKYGLTNKISKKLETGSKKYDELNEDYFLKVKKRYKSDFEKFNY